LAEQASPSKPTVATQPNLKGDEASLPLSFWGMLVFTGLAAGLAGGLLMRLLHRIEAVAFHSANVGFLEGVRSTSWDRRVLVLLLAGIFGGAVAVLANRFEGDTDLSGAVWTRSGRMPILKSSIKALCSIIVVGMGAAVGRENALKQAGGVIANVSASWRNLPDEQRRLLVACGGGAGMAAAYNVPLGGAFFAMEVLLGSFSMRAVLPAFTASMLATWVSWLLLPDKPTYTIAASTASFSLMAWAFVAGPLCGLLAVPFIRLLGWAKAEKPKGWQTFVLPVLSLALLGGLAVKFPEMLGNGKDVVQLSFLNASTTSLLVVLLLIRPLATALILRSGVPGGLFTPTMCLGAVAGLLLGRGWASILPHSSAKGQLPSFALIGSGAVLAAATQGPVSSIIFVLELTRTADSTMVPLLIAVVLATSVTRLFEERSIYSIEVARS
jgi:CIC family chloride channel protein